MARQDTPMQSVGDGDARIRVAFCHFTADVGGGSDRSLFDLATHLPRERFLPSMILKIGDPMAAKYREAGVHVIELPLIPPRKAFEPAKLARFFLAYWPSVWRIARAVSKLHADVVHVNTLYNLQGPVAARLAGRPLVWHVREIASDSRAARMMVRLASILATRAVAISGTVAETLAVCGDRRRVVFNGIDLSEYKALPDARGLREELGVPPGAPLVSCVGRLEPWKGQHVLVEAAPAILKAHPDARIAIVGRPAVNKPDYGPALQQRCREMGIEGSVIFTGPRSDVPVLLAASDVLVLPTATAEPFGRTVVEAMAAGCPVVATAAGGPLDTVVDSETGWLVPTEDPGALAEKVIDLLSEPERAREMGKRGRARAYERFDLTRVVTDMAALFEEVVASM